MIRQTHLIAVVGAFLVGCAVLLVGCSGAGSGALQEEQGNTEAIKDQERSSEATTEEARCEGTQTFKIKEKESGVITKFTTNDVPGCPKGGLLSGTDKADYLAGKDGDDEIHGLGANDGLFGGSGSDVLYGGDGNDALHGSFTLTWTPRTYSTPDANTKDVLHGGPGKDWLEDLDGGDDVLYGGDGDDERLWGGKGEDVIYGGDGNDYIDGATVDPTVMPLRVRKQRDELYCGEGEDHYIADKLDYVDSSCEVKQPPANL